VTLLNYKVVTTDTFVKPSTKCPAYMRYQAFGQVIEIKKGTLTIQNEIEGFVKFPIRYLKVDKEKTLLYKLTGVNPNDEES